VDGGRPTGPADILFCEEASDVSVSVASTKDVPGPWTNGYDVRLVAYDRMSDVKHKTGLKEFAKMLGPAS
jgi:hypothetical protein